jgi:hypothetical protein
MKIKTITNYLSVFVLALFVNNIQAQYTSAACNSAYENILTSGTFVANSAGDDNLTTIALPWTFTFYGVNQTTVNVATNGFLTFPGTNIAGAPFTNQALAIGNNGIFPFWDDLNGAPGVYTQSMGVAPNRRFIIQWNKPFFGGSDPVDFEVVLFETTNRIQFRYLDLNNGNGSGATVGIAGPAGTSVLQLGFNQAILSQGQCIEFSPPAGCTLTAPANITVNSNPGVCGANVFFNIGASTGCGAVNVVPPSGSFFPAGRTTTVTATSGFTVVTFTVTVLDLEPPLFTPDCPKGGVVNLNAGPGECEVAWNAPMFMAMDNCPAGAYFGNRSTATVCLPPASYWSITGGAASWGVMFDLINTSGSILNLQLLGERAFANVPHTIYYTTAPGSHVPVQATPGAWTQCATRTPRFGGQFTNTIDSFNLLTGTRSDTIKRCEPIETETTVVGCLTMAAGERRGIYIHAPGTGGTNASLFSGCGGRAMGDANINTPIDGATYTGGQFAAPFINSSFGFGGANWIGVIGYNLASSTRVPITQTCGAPYGPGCFFPIGCQRICYRATDAVGNVATCEFQVCVNAYANPTRALACNDEIQISLDQNCSATIGADMVLEGGPYACYDNYIVEARYWTGGGLIDRNPNLAGVQINGSDIGKELKLTVRDPLTGNSCWGHATVEDKLAPILTCPADRTFSCAINPIPANTGTPSIVENCGGVNLSYRDNSTQGNCALGYSRRILRTWTAVDGSGNRGTCVQTITIGLGDLFEVTVPGNYDNLDLPMLACDEKIDRNKNVTPHMADFPECVDGYILDSAFWLANPNQPDQYPNRRLPRVLGWNCIDDVNSPWFGHPNPDPVYYPSHRQWSQTNPLCWGPDRHIMWVGTGKPGGAECFNLSVTYKDVVFNLATPGCDAGPVGCYKVLRQWTVMDWCTSVLGGHNQIIKVTDVEGPQVLYPDSARVNMESYACVSAVGKFHQPGS